MWVWRRPPIILHSDGVFSAYFLLVNHFWMHFLFSVSMFYFFVTGLCCPEMQRDFFPKFNLHCGWEISCILSMYALSGFCRKAEVDVVPVKIINGAVQLLKQLNVSFPTVSERIVIFNLFSSKVLSTFFNQEKLDWSTILGGLCI